LPKLCCSFNKPFAKQLITIIQPEFAPPLNSAKILMDVLFHWWRDKAVRPQEQFKGPLTSMQEFNFGWQGDVTTDRARS
jgi:hypothetical protein